MLSPLFNRKTITLIDTSWILHRSVHSPQAKRVSGFTGNPYSGPSYIFFQSILTIAQRFENLVFVLDGYPKSKHDLFPEYKAQRKAQREKDPEYEVQKEARKHLRNWIYETLPTVVAYSPFEEADDCIGSIAAQMAPKGVRVDILSADKDIWQLQTDMVHIWRTGAEGFEEITPAIIQEEFECPPNKIPHYKAWFGDKSDNLPKIFRMPSKLATALINGSNDLEDAIVKLPEFVDGDWLPKFQAHIDQARINLDIATIRKELQVPFAYFAPDASVLQGILDAFQVKGYTAQDLFGALAPQQRDTLALLVEMGMLNDQTHMPYEVLANKTKSC